MTPNRIGQHPLEQPLAELERELIATDLAGPVKRFNP